jgi:hypothetical protein
LILQCLIPRTSSRCIALPHYNGIHPIKSIVIINNS